MSKDTLWPGGKVKANVEYFDASNVPEMENQYNSIKFDDLSVRKNFIRKVYLILMAQLLLTFGIVAVFVINERVQLFVFQNPGIFWLSFVVLLVTMLIMACCDDVRRQTPMNFIFLTIFTLAESFMLGMLTSLYARREILIAVGITAVLCLTLSLYAMQTKYDFTIMGGILLISLMVFLIFGLLALFFPGRVMTLVYSSLGAVLFSVYIIYDTQLMLGGQHKYSVSPEEYVFAALNLYLDIINIFLYVLSLISIGRN